MDVRLPDGTIVKNVPEGITQSELMARVGKMSAPASPAKPAPQPEITDAEMIAGNPLTRFAIGVASPILGAAQLGAELIGDKSGSDTLKQLEQMKKRGMSPAADLKRLEQSRATLAKLPGYEATIADIDKQISAIRSGGTSDKQEDAGFDFAGLLGTVASPVSLAATGVKAAPTAMGRIKQGSLIGAGFGAATPVTEGENFVGSKTAQIGTGATVGAVVPSVVESVRAFAPGGLVQRTFYPKAGDIANRAAGNERDAVIQALESQRSQVPGVNWTAGQASVPANSPQFAALQKVAEKKMPEVYGQMGVKGEQQAARQAAVRAISNVPEFDNPVMKNMDAAQAVRSAAASSNYAKAFQNQIKADPELAQLAKNPFFGEAAKDATKLAQANNIDPKKNLTEFLHFVKVSLDKQLQKSGDTALGNTEKKAVMDLQKNLVDWMGKKNPDYDAARLAFIADSAPVNQMKVGQKLEDALTQPLTGTERAVPFGTAVRSAENTISKSTGRPQIADLKPQQRNVVDAVMGDLQRNDQLKRLASEGADSLSDRLQPAVVPPTGIFKPILSAARSLVNRFSEGSVDRAVLELAPLMKNPQAVAEAMKSASPQQQRVINAMIDRAARLGIIGQTTLAAQQEQF
jgi:hypothetical protein